MQYVQIHIYHTLHCLTEISTSRKKKNDTKSLHCLYLVRISPIPQHDYITESQHSDISSASIKNLLLLESSLNINSKWPPTLDPAISTLVYHCFFIVLYHHVSLTGATSQTECWVSGLKLHILCTFETL